MIYDLLKNGLVLGSVYLLFSTGFALVFGSFNIMNLAHGAVMTFGGFVGIFSDHYLDFPIVVTLLIAACAAGGMNALLDALILRPIARRGAKLPMAAQELAPIVATLSFATIVTALLVQTTRAVDFTFKNADFLSRPIRIGDSTISSLALGIIASAFIITALLHLVIAKTRAGMAIRAVAEDRQMAAALGVRSNIVSAVTFFTSGAMAGICGVLVGILYSNVNVALGEQFLLFGFVIIIVGGVGSLAGTAIASMLIGITQTIASSFFQSSAIEVAVFATLLLTLLVRPSGIMGRSALAAGVARK